MMLRYLTYALRNLERNRLFAAVNVLGLTIGLTAFILIMLYVRYEFSFDNFHNSPESIYRVTTKVALQHEIINHESSTYQGIVNTLKNDLPGVTKITVISAFDSDATLLRIKNGEDQVIPLQNYKGLYADDSFFQVLSFPLARGEEESVLASPYSAVISEKWATSYFSGGFIGKTIEFKDDDGIAKVLTITGVMRDVPPNSHLKFDIVINVPEEEGSFWDWVGHAYLKLQNGIDPLKLEHELDAIAVRNNGLKRNRNDYGQISTFKLQPLRSIHLNSRLDYEFEPGGNSLLVYSLMALAFLILVVAWINYINLYTAIAVQKSKQIGIRKLLGASKSSLTYQTLADSGLSNLLAFALAIFAAWLILPMFATFAGIPVKMITLNDSSLWFGAVGFLVISTLVSGTYPSIQVASLKSLAAMQDKVSRSVGLPLRKTLVITQFVVATMMIITTLVAYRQLEFMQDKELGMNIRGVMIIKSLNFDKETWSDSAGGYVVDPTYQLKAVSFMNEVRQNQNIVNTASASHLPGQLPNWGTEFEVDDIVPSKGFSLKAIGIDYNFIPTLTIKLVAGRNFSHDYPSDQGNENKRAVIINEAASRLLGFTSPENAVSKHIRTYWGADYEIVGVVESFHQLSVKEVVPPLYFILQPRALPYFVVKFQNSDIPTTIAEIKSIWSRHFTDYPFDYFFLDQYFDRQYESDMKFSGVTSIFTCLALLIACMGLFGMTAYAIVQRSKEIAIRKVAGASAYNVIALFTGDFVRLIFISSLIAIPAVFIFLSAWLDTYAHKISLTWWMFAVPAVAITTMAVATVTLQTFRLALKSPAERLKHE